MAKEGLRPGSVEVDPGLRGGPSPQKTYLAVLNNERGKMVWDCNSTATHPGRTHHSSFDAIRCALDELKRRGAGA